MAKKKQKKECDICGAQGRSVFSKGSRFLLSTEECSDCTGTGYELDTLREDTDGQTKKKRKTKKKL